MTKDAFMTARWNNLLNLGMGVSALVFGIVVLAATIMSDLASFLVITGIGAFY